MFKNYLKVALRNMRRNRTFVLINVIGLGISIACCIVAYLNWEYNAKFDGHHENAETIYRINFIRNMGGRDIKNGSCPYPLAEAVSQNVPQVTSFARYENLGGNFKVDNQVFSSWVFAVDPAFVELFSFEFVEGSGTSLSDSRTILVQETLREKYWPDKSSIIGETIALIQGEEVIDYVVGGVYREQPANSSMGAEAIINYEGYLNVRGWDINDWSQFNTTFVQVEDASQVDEVEAQLSQYVQVQNQAKEDYKVAHYYLDPFVGMAVRSENEGVWNHWFRRSLPTAADLSPGIMALFLLLIACFNFTNTSIAVVNRRIKEIGVRKVMGSTRRQIITQFLGENLMLTFFALLLGLILAAVMVPLYSSMWVFLEIRFTLFENMQLVGFIVALLFFTAMVAGSYPALYVSKFQPTSIFRGGLKFSGTNFFTRTLLTLQFALSLTAIISGFVFAQNATYQEEYDLGFETDGVLYAFMGSGQDFRKFRNSIEDNVLVSSIAGANNNISSSWYTDPLAAEGKEFDVDILEVGADYLPTVGAKVLAGRNFKADSQYDVENAAIVNEELVRLMGWTNALDKQFRLKDTINLTVVGVVKNIHNDGGLWQPLEPMVLRATEPENYDWLVVRTDLANAKQLKDDMEEDWKSVFPNRVPAIQYMDQEMVQAQEVNANVKAMFGFLAIVAALLSIIGLFSLVSMNINKNMKQIGIRKILGAPTKNLAYRISREFVVILMISTVLGIAAGYFLTNLLLDNIWAYHIDIHPVTLALAATILFGACLLAVGRLIVRAVSTIPVKLLQD